MFKRFAPLALLLALLAACAAPTDATIGDPTDAPASAASKAAPHKASNAPGISPKDYKITVKTLTKQCFGSAGCNVTARLTVTGLTEATKTTPAELTVVMKGADDGAQVQTITLDDQGNYDSPEVFTSTPNKGTKLTAKVTEVMKL